MSKRPKKVTKKWTMRNGEKIRICDMDDIHLINTIKMLERIAKNALNNEISAGYSMLGFLQGEIALDSVERGLDYLESEYPWDEFVPAIYEDLTNEARRRGLEYEQAT